MKKILFVLPTLTIGGMEKVLVNLVNSLDEDKYEIHIKTIYHHFDLQKDIKKRIKVSSFYKSSQNEKINYWKIRAYTFFFKKAPASLLHKLFIKEKYDVEVGFFRGASIKIISGSNNLKSRKLAWVHSDFTKCSGVFDWFKNEEETICAYKKFNNIICVSEYTKEKFIERMGIKEKVIVRYNINLYKDIISKSNETIDKDNINNEFNICTVGRIVEAKGFDRLLKVHKRLIDENINHNLLIVGDGPLRTQLEEYVEENNLFKTVKLIGQQDNPYKYMKKCDLFVCSSRWEGFSTVVSEAVILEVPVVTTKVSGVKELFLENIYGLIVENDDEALYEGIKEMIIDKQLYSRYKAKVKERSVFFDEDKSIKQIEMLF